MLYYGHRSVSNIQFDIKIQTCQNIYMSESNRIHYSRETKRKARQRYYDSESTCFRSYRAVAKELGIRRFQTIAEWAKRDGWNPGKAPATFAKDCDFVEMLKVQIDEWDQIGERALSLLLTPEKHRMFGTVLAAFEKSTKQQRDLTCLLEHAIKQASTPDNPEGSQLFPILPDVDS